MQVHICCTWFWDWLQFSTDSRAKLRSIRFGERRFCTKTTSSQLKTVHADAIRNCKIANVKCVWFFLSLGFGVHISLNSRLFVNYCIKNKQRRRQMQNFNICQHWSILVFFWYQFVYNSFFYVLVKIYLVFHLSSFIYGLFGLRFVIHFHFNFNFHFHFIYWFIFL